MNKQTACDNKYYRTHCKVKQAFMRKWYSLIDKVYSTSNMEAAFHKVRKNKGAKTKGVDNISIVDFGKHLYANLCQIQSELKSGSYQPSAVKRVYIDKSDGGKRGLGIPTIKDRIVQAAIVQIVKTFKDKVRKLTPRTKGKSIYYFIQQLNYLLRGYANYFRIGLVKGLFEELMSWIRRRLRMMIMKSWKSWKPLHKRLRRMGYKGSFEKISVTRWRNSNSPLIHMALPTKSFEKVKLYSMEKVATNTLHQYYDVVLNRI